MRRLFAIAFVAACGGQGVDIEVLPDTKQFDAVELWVSYGVCKTPDGNPCDGIGWPNAQLRPSGDVYTVGEYPSADDPSGHVIDEKAFRIDSRYIVDGVGHMHLDTVPGSETPYVIAVVGFQGTKAVGAKILSPIEIPTDDQVHWRVDLHDVGDVTADTSTDPGDGLKYNALVWARDSAPTDYAGCLAYQKWTGTEWETLYFVPKNDPDCDGQPPDCIPYWYMAPVGSARCVDYSQNLAGVCMVGTQTCMTETDLESCKLQSAPSVCVGSAVCAACKDADDLGSCILSQIPSNATLSDTPVPMSACAMIGFDAPCSNSSNPMGWKATLFIQGGVCMGSPMLPTAVLRDVATPFTGGQIMKSVSGANVSIHAFPITTGTTG